jgi:hypothetical protein
MFGAGVGLDFGISRSLDVSVDICYRYATIADERYAPACTPATSLAYDEVHSGVLRLGLTF